jgi:hypothetical protein
MIYLLTITINNTQDYTTSINTNITTFLTRTVAQVNDITKHLTAITTLYELLLNMWKQI